MDGTMNKLKKKIHWKLLLLTSRLYARVFDSWQKSLGIEQHPFIQMGKHNDEIRKEMK